MKKFLVYLMMAVSSLSFISLSSCDSGTDDDVDVVEEGDYSNLPIGGGTLTINGVKCTLEQYKVSNGGFPAIEYTIDGNEYSIWMYFGVLKPLEYFDLYEFNFVPIINGKIKVGDNLMKIYDADDTMGNTFYQYVSGNLLVLDIHEEPNESDWDKQYVLLRFDNLKMLYEDDFDENIKHTYVLNGTIKFYYFIG
jgi:hypothetical protein